MNDIRLPPKWIELNITKKECGAFIPTLDDDSVCQCGRNQTDHKDFAKFLHHPDTWNPSTHTRSFPTDAYGTIVFEGEHHPNKAHFVRLAYDTNPELVIQMMNLVWGLPMPKLLITIQGSSTNFDLPPRLGKLIQTGLIKAAKSCNAWIFTTGLNDGVTRHVGNALNYDRNAGAKKTGVGRVVAVGIPPWGLVEHRDELLLRNKEKVYNPLEHVNSQYRILNPKHNNFLMVDNGSVGKIGGETYFRRRLEKCIARHPTGPNRTCDVPVVCIVIEGGLFTLRIIGDYLHDDPPTPVVVVAGTGRTAELLGWIVRKLESTDADIEVFRDDIYLIMMRVYRTNQMQCAVVFEEVKRIISKRHLVTFFNLHPNEEDFDFVILASIFRSQHWTPLQQLSLTLVWDRVDIAETEVFVYGREWSTANLELAMMEALLSNRLDFVNLLLEHGLNMQSFLTVSRLEALYNTDHFNVLKLMVVELAKLKSRKRRKIDGEMRITIHDVGVAISHMMGHIYKSNYIHMVSNAVASMSSIGLGFTGVDAQKEMNLLNPFDDLFVWAVLSKRHSMAVLLWRHGQGALVKSLVAIKLNKFIAEQLVEKSAANLATDFQNFATEWENYSYELVDSCFKQDQTLARQLLTMELARWSKMTNLQLAVIANHRILLGHPICQILLADLWMGALNIKTHATIKVLFGIIFPPIVFSLEFKSTEELKLLPHQEKAAHQAQSRFPYENESDNNSIITQNLTKSKASFGSIFHRRKRLPKPQEMKTAADLTPVHLGHEQRPRVSKGTHGEPPQGSQNHVVDINPDDITLHTIKSKIALPSNKSYFWGQKQRSSYVTTKRPIPTWKQFYEFQRAPITNFYRHAMAYLAFVVMLSYLILVPQEKHKMGLIEIYIIAYLVSLGLEVCRDFLLIDSLNWSQKLIEFRGHFWQISDFIVITFFMVGVALRNSEYYQYGMLVYRVSSIYWILRLYKYMGVHQFLGPKLVMMSKMLKHMAYFALIIFILVIAFGIAREAIRFPDLQPSQRNIGEAFLEPYVWLYGEVDLESLSPQCGNPNEEPCPVGFWIIPIAWVVYMMVSNILIVNVLIAVFNGIYSEIDAIALEVWMFQRFNFVMEYEGKPILPPPAMIITHVYYVLRWMLTKVKLCLCEQELDTEFEDEDGPKIILGNNHRLKTFLTPAEENMVFEFEEDNVVLVGNKGANVSSNVYFEEGSGEINSSGVARIEPHTTFETVKDRQLQQLKNNFRDLTSELESHRDKLDKLIAYWEREVERDGNSLNDPSEVTMIRTMDAATGTTAHK